MSSSVSSLSPKNHGLTAGTTRPRTKSVNTDHTQFRDKYQPHETQVTSPSTAALDQIMSNLSQPQHQSHHHHHQQHQHHQHFVSNGVSDVHHSHHHSHNQSGGSRHFPLLPSTLPAGPAMHDPMHSRSHSQTTVVESASPTSDYFQHYRSSAAATLSVDQDTNYDPGTPPAQIQSFHSVYTSKNSSSASLVGANFANPTSSTGAISSSSLNTLVGASPLQHRPHTPLKSSFPASVTSDSHNNSMMNSEGVSSAGADANPSEHPGEPPISTRKPSLLRSLSTKSGREQLMTPEKSVGSLPTMQHQSGRGRHEGATFMGMSLKHLSLLVLLLQNSALVIMMRYSRVAVEPGQPMYLASTAVFFAELIKFATCLGILTYKTQSIPRTIYILRKEIWDKPQEILKMLIPSGLYALQNNLLYLALSNLEASTFQVTYQLKILSTAMFSVLMLNKRLSRQKWFSLCLLMVGVTLVQLQNVGTPKSPIAALEDNDEPDSEIMDAMHDGAEAEADIGGDDEDSQNPIVGLFAVLTSCISSGFAGCYFEKILKGNETDMWVRNLQLGISGTMFSFLAMFYDRQKIMDGGMLQGYSTATWLVVINQALGGLLVAIVVKYADNILKGFATSLSIITSGMISVYFFDFEPSIQFQLGTLVVILSTFLYGRPDAAVPRFVRREKKRQSVPPALRFGGSKD
ncbi:hypothetical protein BGZ92_003083 [Podila epicladia]|nr:hypothetical protein BGZ92_003083 [Podila epicladia]